MKLNARPIVEDRFWIIEHNGEKVGTLRYGDDYILTVNRKNFRYATLNGLQEKLDIDFSAPQQIESSAAKEYDVHGYPCKTEPYNGIYDLKRKLPLYTKTEKSQSFYCAGYYAVKFDNGWVKAYCPKLITLSRNTYLGPFKTRLEMQESLRKASNE